jgi:glucoamylase
LAGERGHYELAAGRDGALYLRALENFAQGGILAEQVWDAPDRPEARLWLGRPTGSAMPLVWAHAEYLTLLRSVADGQVFDFIPELAARYQANRKSLCLEFWKPNRHATRLRAGQTLRVQAPAPFHLHWSADEWRSVADTPARTTPLGIWYVDVPTSRDQRAPLRFTFRWEALNRWEGRDYEVALVTG